MGDNTKVLGTFEGPKDFVWYVKITLFSILDGNGENRNDVEV
jgi:hypothetical protein